MRLAGQRENHAFVRRHRVQQTSSVLSARYVIILRTRRLAALHRHAYRLSAHRTTLVSLRVEHGSNLARLHGIDVLKEKARIPRHTRDVHPDSVHTQLHTASFSPTQATHHRRKPRSAVLAMRIREKRKLRRTSRPKKEESRGRSSWRERRLCRTDSREAGCFRPAKNLCRSSRLAGTTLRWPRIPFRRGLSLRG